MVKSLADGINRATGRIRCSVSNQTTLQIFLLTAGMALGTLALPLILLDLHVPRDAGPRLLHLLRMEQWLWVGIWAMLMVMGFLLWRLLRGTKPIAAAIETESNTDAVDEDSENAGVLTPLSIAALGQLNQQLITPLAHMRAACDVLASADEAGRFQNPLSVIRSASDMMRLTVENLIDKLELRGNRLKFEPRPVNLRDQLEDLCAQWQPVAQRYRAIVHYLCYQDVPSLLEVDNRLLLRLTSNLVSTLLNNFNLGDVAVTLMELEQDERTQESLLQLKVDARGQISSNRLAERLEAISDMPADQLIVSEHLDLWLACQFAKLHGSFIDVSESGNGRIGYMLEFKARSLGTAHPPRQWLARMRCGLLCSSQVATQAWRGNLAALGAVVQVDLDGAPPDLLFTDEASWTRLPIRTRQKLEQAPTTLIFLCDRITLRGKPTRKPAWANFALPLFIRNRALQTALSRILKGGDAVSSDLAPPPKTHQGLVSGNGNNETSVMFSGRTALVIDDDPIYRIHLKRMLTSLGIDVTVASGGKEGVSIARSRDMDLVLTDMHMQDIDGTGVARMLRRQQRHEHTPIIAITANIQSSVRHELLNAGVGSVLAKPVAMGELINVLTQYLSPSSHGVTERLESDSNPASQTDSVLTTLLCDELPIYRESLLKDKRDRDPLRHTAHKLRGAAACCQAHKLQECAAQLEDGIHANFEWPRIESMLQQVIQCIDETIAEHQCQVHE